MTVLHDLTFYTFPNEGETECLHIGLFASHGDAAAVAARYRGEVPGFKDYDCVARIEEVPVADADVDARELWRFVGWNVDARGNEVDIIRSACYGSRGEAEAALDCAMRETPRQEWAMNRCIVGRCDWQEGFVRS